MFDDDDDTEYSRAAGQSILAELTCEREGHELEQTLRARGGVDIYCTRCFTYFTTDDGYSRPRR